MKQYLSLVRRHLDHGVFRGDRTGTGTFALFGYQMRFGLRHSFPLVTTKHVHLRSIIQELLWFLSGSTDNNALNAMDVKIWNEWAIPAIKTLSVTDRWGRLHTQLLNQHGVQEGGRLYKQICNNQPTGQVEEEAHLALDDAGIPRTGPDELAGQLGPIYGKQWRSWPGRLQEKDLCYGTWSDHVIEGEQWFGGAGQDGFFRQEPIDQIAIVVRNLSDPKTKYSRRHIVSAWNPADLPDETISPQDNVRAGKMALAPCHCMFQFFAEPIPAIDRVKWVRENLPEQAKRIDDQLIEEIKAGRFRLGSIEEGDERVIDRNYELFLAVPGVPTDYLSCQLYQRSADMMLGIPFNIASYALFTMMVAQVTGMIAKELVHTLGDSHVYSNHVEGAQLQLSREPHALPIMRINPDVKDIFAFKLEDFTLEDYTHDEKIVFKVAV